MTTELLDRTGKRGGPASESHRRPDMNRLAYVIVFTKRYDEMQRFYQDGVGLELRGSQDGWTEFDTAGASFALHKMDDDERNGVMLRFESKNLVQDMSRLLGRGARFDGDVIEFGAGRLVNLWDPEDNLITLFEPASPIPSGLGPALGRVILNCEDFADTVAFYRDTMAFEIARQAEHWVEFDTGLTRLALHTRPHDQTHPRHAEQPIAYTFETDDINAMVDEVRGRGLHFTTAPITEDFGVYAELTDPDQRIVVLREPPAPEGIEEALAEAFEEGAVPRQTGMRKPPKKGSRGVASVSVKPGRKVVKAATKRAAAAAAAKPKPAPARAKRAASTRGAGPEHTRLKPKTLRDTGRAKMKPAIGRLKKSVRETMATKKVSTAQSSRKKPVKRSTAKSRVKAAAKGGKRR